MAKNKKRKSAKKPYYVQTVERYQKIHQLDGSVKMVLAEKRKIVHSRRVLLPGPTAAEKAIEGLFDLPKTGEDGN